METYGAHRKVDIIHVSFNFSVGLLAYYHHKAYKKNPILLFMALKLQQGRNDLDRYIEVEIPLEELVVAGRFLESDWHDAEGCQGDHMHWYKKVLETYDPETDSVLLSQQGSRRLLDNLDKPDKKYSRQELYEEALKMNWKVREADYHLF